MACQYTPAADLTIRVPLVTFILLDIYKRHTNQSVPLRANIRIILHFNGLGDTATNVLRLPLVQAEEFFTGFHNTTTFTVNGKSLESWKINLLVPPDFCGIQLNELNSHTHWYFLTVFLNPLQVIADVFPGDKDQSNCPTPSCTSAAFCSFNGTSLYNVKPAKNYLRFLTFLSSQVFVNDLTPKVSSIERYATFR